MLARITEREVEAGRMAPDDDFRQLAAAGGQVLGDSTYTTAKPARRGNWVTMAFAVVAVVLWALSIEPLGISALWLIRSEEHTSELQSLMRISYAVSCLQ